MKTLDYMIHKQFFDYCPIRWHLYNWNWFNQFIYSEDIEYIFCIEKMKEIVDYANKDNRSYSLTQLQLLFHSSLDEYADSERILNYDILHDAYTCYRNRILDILLDEISTPSKEQYIISLILPFLLHCWLIKSTK